MTNCFKFNERLAMDSTENHLGDIKTPLSDENMQNHIFIAIFSSVAFTHLHTALLLSLCLYLV